MKKRKIIKMLNEYCNNEIPINLNSLRNTLKYNKISYKLYTVNKSYVKDIYKNCDIRVYAMQQNFEIRIFNLFTVNYYILVPIDKPSNVNCLVLHKMRIFKKKY